VPEHLHLGFAVRTRPHQAQRARVAELVERDLLCLLEGCAQAGRDSWVLAQQRLVGDQRVHHREDAGARVELALYGGVVGEQARHLRRREQLGRSTSASSAPASSMGPSSPDRTCSMTTPGGA
jgi:hypothetical protein